MSELVAEPGGKLPCLGPKDFGPMERLDFGDGPDGLRRASGYAQSVLDCGSPLPLLAQPG